MTDSPFFTVSLSAVLFYPQVQLENTLSLAQQFVVATGGIFEPNPTILPQQPNLPPEVPFLIFKSSPEAYQCEISRARVSFHYQDRANRREPFDVCQSRWRGSLDAVLQAVAEGIPGQPHRLGFVVKLLAEVEEDGAAFLSRKFMGGGWDGSEELQAHALHKVTLGGRLINRWVRLRSVRVANAAFPNRHLLAELDLNTLQEQAAPIRGQAVSDFYLEASRHIEREVLGKLLAL